MQRAVAEHNAVSLPREAHAHVASVAVVITYLIGERKSARGAAIRQGAVGSVRVMMKSSVAMGAVVDKLFLTRDGMSGCATA
jgi:hypothetical protein